MTVPPIRLGFNIDHVATLRNARGGVHPDPVRAARCVLEAGADNITAHLREDRRHIRDDDIRRLIVELDCPVNFEMAATEEMRTIALKTLPYAACIVPERREEHTTEGGLDVVAQFDALAPVVADLVEAEIQVSLFIAAEGRQIEAASRLGAPAIEIHAGAWCDALAEGRRDDAETEWRCIKEGAQFAHQLGLEVHAGHGLNYETAETISTLPEILELNIGHYLIGESVFVGLSETAWRMRQAMDKGRAALEALTSEGVDQES